MCGIILPCGAALPEAAPWLSKMDEPHYYYVNCPLYNDDLSINRKWEILKVTLKFRFFECSIHKSYSAYCDRIAVWRDSKGNSF